MKTKNAHIHIGKCALDSRGFSLIELMIVTAILGILGVMVGVYINADDAKLRSAAFNLGSRFKQARYEATRRAHNVYLEFHTNVGAADYETVVKVATPANGYMLWVDNNENRTYDGGDEVIGDKVEFSTTRMELYDPDAVTGGPAAGPDANAIGDGVSATNERFQFSPNGDCTGGAAYICFSRGAVGAKEISAGPWAVIVSPSGRMRLSEWRNGNWQ